MKTRELTLPGKALDALVEEGAIEKVKDLIKYMANLDKPLSKGKEEQSVKTF